MPQGGELVFVWQSTPNVLAFKRPSGKEENAWSSVLSPVLPCYRFSPPV